MLAPGRPDDGMMRTLLEIIDVTRDGGRPEYEELRYAVCALNALTTFDEQALKKLAQAEQEHKKPMLAWSARFQYDERFNRMKRALNSDPKIWVGWNNDPENPEFVKRRRSAIRLFEKVAGIRK